MTHGAPKPKTMLTLGLVGLLVALGVGVSDFACQAARADDDTERERGRFKQCVTHTTRAPYRAYGYDHEVVLTNSCDHTESCTIESASISTPVTVDVSGKSEQVVVLRRGSPARAFEAKVTCAKK